eukprot:1674814-Alexandrium_andersonii.AAC.1
MEVATPLRPMWAPMRSHPWGLPAHSPVCAEGSGCAPPHRCPGRCAAPPSSERLRCRPKSASRRRTPPPLQPRPGT